MQSNVKKWGNSLAVRLPAECIRASGLKDGAAVDVTVTPSGQIQIAATAHFDKAKFLRGLDSLHRGMAESPAVVADLRKAARY